MIALHLKAYEKKEVKQLSCVITEWILYFISLFVKRKQPCRKRNEQNINKTLTHNFFI